MIVILIHRKIHKFDIENTACEFIDLFQVFVVNWSESESLLSPSTSVQGHERQLNQIYNK